MATPADKPSASRKEALIESLRKDAKGSAQKEKLSMVAKQVKKSRGKNTGVLVAALIVLVTLGIVALRPGGVLEKFIRPNGASPPVGQAQFFATGQANCDSENMQTCCDCWKGCYDGCCDDVGSCMQRCADLHGCYNCTEGGKTPYDCALPVCKQCGGGNVTV